MITFTPLVTPCKCSLNLFKPLHDQSLFIGFSVNAASAGKINSNAKSFTPLLVVCLPRCMAATLMPSTIQTERNKGNLCTVGQKFMFITGRQQQCREERDEA